MAEKLLTQADLAERWQLNVESIRKLRVEGKLQPVKHLLPTIRFSLSYVEKLEGIEIDRMSAIERKRLENEILKLQQENEILRGTITRVFQSTAQVMGYKEE